MAGSFFPIHDILSPQILAAEKDFLIVYKPPRMHSAPHIAPHSAPLSDTHGDTLLDWCYGLFPGIAALPGRRPGEGGLLHRLDYETQGLMLLARTVKGMESLLVRQERGMILKEYSALTAESSGNLPGFPPQKPELPHGVFNGKDAAGLPFQIKSAFRPYGPGRKEVRPVVDGQKKSKEAAFDSGGPYITEILEARSAGELFVSLSLRIFRGFRHQVRNHLAWIGRPVLNDALYGGLSCGKGLLGLRAFSLAFNDPSSGAELFYSTAPLDPEHLE